MTEMADDKKTIGVGAVGIKDVESEGLAPKMPSDGAFKLVAFSDEGCEEGAPERKPVRYYADYNMLLKDPDVELVLVGGPVEKRRDFALRALNAGRHVVTENPLAEDAYGAERIMKTALKRGLVATCVLEGRDDADYVALRSALAGANVSRIYGIQGHRAYTQQEWETAQAEGLLEAFGFDLLDQFQTLIDGDFKSVSAHLYRSRQGGPVEDFFIYIAMRGQGWATLHGSLFSGAALPRWTAFVPGAVIVASGGQAVLHDADGARVLEQPGEPEAFWDNLYRAIREGAELKCHPVDVVRAMKLHEAALESAEVGEPITL